MNTNKKSTAKHKRNTTGNETKRKENGTKSINIKFQEVAVVDMVATAVMAVL